MFLHLNITNETAVKESIQRTVERFGAIHILVNCAGILSASPTLTSKGVMDFASFKRTVEINLYGTVYCAAHAAFHMSKNEPEGDAKERGVIINVSSVAAFEG